ncbi:hypothetical protein ACJIZ3_006060 [Penstemon smallii]|uniref:Replication protein A 70 kDa DNA-binding subunit B/D first OB fold domain-containing protein n=1 Tax=Penstemon smallii TaxID=265156 RepID=A0ABD3S6L6_9LAMI
MTKYMHIQDVDTSPKKWTVMVIVHEKTQPRASGNSPTRQQRVVFMDEMGQKVMATIYDLDIKLFKDEFKVGLTYIISNAKVKLLEDKYNRFNYPYQWTIHRGVLFKELKGEVIRKSIVRQ